MMRKFFTFLAVIFCSVNNLSAGENIISIQLGYAPEVGGSMHTGWQYENLGNYDGINDINRSDGSGNTTTIEKPLGVLINLGYRNLGDVIYFKTGLTAVYSFHGGDGKTLDQTGSEVVEASYKVFWGEIPLIWGIYVDFWDEVRLSLGAGVAFAYGMYMNSFSSASLDNSASFKGYGFPLLAEFNCEYRLSENTASMATIQYSRGESKTIESGDDYARLDFTCFRFMMGLSRRIDF